MLGGPAGAAQGCRSARTEHTRDSDVTDIVVEKREAEMTAIEPTSSCPTRQHRFVSITQNSRYKFAMYTYFLCAVKVEEKALSARITAASAPSLQRFQTSNFLDAKVISF
jgi:hypothetical protein